MAALLSTTATHAHLPSRETQDREAFFQRGTQAAAGAFHRTVGNPVSQEGKWWGDFEKSGKAILIYVDELASKDSEAAMWFLVTGGKYGFSSKTATQDEQQLILSAMQKVAKSFAASENKKAAYESWVGMEKAHQAGHVHLQMIYNQIDELKKTVDTLNTKIGGMEREIGDQKIKIGLLEGEIRGLKVVNSSLEERIVKLQEEQLKTEAKLESSRLDRIKDLKELNEQRIAAEENAEKRFQAFFGVFKAQADESKKEQSEMIKILSEKVVNSETATKSMVEEITKNFRSMFIQSEASAKERENNFLAMIEANKREAQKREEELLARIAKIEQEAREREQAILAVIGKDVERLPHIERLADKSVELGFQNRDLSQETLRTTNPTAFNQYMKSFH